MIDVDDSGSAAARALGLSMMVLIVVACDQPVPQSVEYGVLFDDQLAAVDAVSPHTRFDGVWGSLLTDRGWAPPESDPSGFFSWAIDGESIAYFLRPLGFDDLDFWALVAPLSYPGSPIQSVTLYLNGTPTRTVSLQSGWQEVRVPLPRNSLKSGLNEVRMKFAHRTRPVDVGLNADARRLSATFRSLAVLPRGVKDAADFLNAAQALPHRGEIELPPGGAYALPLPPSSETTLQASLSSSCDSCTLTAELLLPKGDIRHLDTVAVPGQLRLAFATGEEGISSIRLRVIGGVEAVDNGDRVVVRFLEPGLGVRHRALKSPDRPHVFIYMIDTLRSDALEPYGAPEGFSPYLEAFSKDAVVYEYAWTVSSWTLPSTVSLLTGRLPRVHGVMKGDVKFSMESPARSLAWWLSSQGYDTVGISQSFVAGDSFGVDTGFSEFFLSNQLNSRLLRSQGARNIFVRWLSAVSEWGDPIFAYIHTVDPHAPYAPEKGYRSLAQTNPGTLAPEAYSPAAFLAQDFGQIPSEIAHLRALYQGEVQFADFQFGKFIRTLRYLRLYNQSLVAVVSDHGEEFGEHGGFDHGRTVYEEMLQIPLIVKYPNGRGAGKTIAQPVSSIDLAPTICALVTPDAGDASSCDSFFDGTELPQSVAAGRRGLIAEVNPAPSKTLHEVDYEALLIDDVKCILSKNRTDQFGNPIPTWQIYDLSTDPQEGSPLDSGTSAAQRCIDALTRLDRITGNQEEPEPTKDEDLEKLRALGYIE